MAASQIKKSPLFSFFQPRIDKQIMLSLSRLIDKQIMLSINCIFGFTYWVSGASVELSIVLYIVDLWPLCWSPSIRKQFMN